MCSKHTGSFERKHTIERKHMTRDVGKGIFMPPNFSEAPPTQSDQDHLRS